MTDPLPANWRLGDPIPSGVLYRRRIALGTEAADICVLLERGPNDFAVRAIGPQGMEVSSRFLGYSLSEAIEEAEGLLRDIGWRLQPGGQEDT